MVCDPLEIDENLYFLHFLGILWTGCLIPWIAFLTHGAINPRTWTDCKLYTFLFYFRRHYSWALLAVMCIEKCYAMYFPLKAISVCTVKTAKLVSLFTGIAFVVFDCQLLFLYETYKDINGKKHCRYEPESYESTYIRMDSVFFCVVLFTIMIVPLFICCSKQNWLLFPTYNQQARLWVFQPQGAQQIGAQQCW